MVNIIRELTTLACLVLLALATASSVGAMESEDCLGCHADADTIEDALFIDGGRFDHTAHAEMGCPSCHEGVSEDHPDDGIPPSKANCADCHDAVHADYASSVHAVNAECRDCHNPHQVQNPTEVSGYDMNRQCAACHDPAESVDMHQRWLPQTELHLAALPCVTCHTGSEDYVITLYLTSREKAYGDFELASRDELQKLSGQRDIAHLVDRDGDGTVSLKELRRFNTDRLYQGIRLTGMMTPETVTHTVQTLDNRWDCSFCHASGPGAMQTSFLAFPAGDGRYQRLPVERGAVLDALYGTPDFYMMGATRSRAMNILGLSIIAGGLIMPVGHGTLRFLTRKNRKAKED